MTILKPVSLYADGNEYFSPTGAYYDRRDVDTEIAFLTAELDVARKDIAIWRKYAAEQEMSAAEECELKEKAEAERDRAMRALSNHLCKHDMADWLACGGAHGDGACEVCESGGETGHFHAQLATLTAERDLALGEARGRRAR